MDSWVVSTFWLLRIVLSTESSEQAGDSLLTGSLWLLCGEEPREGRRGGWRPIRTGFLVLTAQGEPLGGETCTPTELEPNPQVILKGRRLEDW